MNIRINGETAAVGDGWSLARLLTEQKVKMPDMVTVERNGEIVDRKTYDTVEIRDGDELEFLYFMGGGA